MYITRSFLNALLIVFEIRGLSLAWPGRRWSLLLFYTQISNLIAAVSSVLLLAAGRQAWAAPIRYLATCMLIMTFLVTAFVLVPMTRKPKLLLATGSCLYHHVLCPAVSTVSYLFAEPHAGRETILLPIAVTMVYGIVLLFLNARRITDGPYPFFRVHHQSVRATILWILVLLGAIAAISAAVYLLAGRITH